jgi:hypothetical protein
VNLTYKRGLDLAEPKEEDLPLFKVIDAANNIYCRY